MVRQGVGLVIRFGQIRGRVRDMVRQGSMSGR